MTDWKNYKWEKRINKMHSSYRKNKSKTITNIPNIGVSFRIVPMIILGITFYVNGIDVSSAIVLSIIFGALFGLRVNVEAIHEKIKKIDEEIENIDRESRNK